MHHDDEGRKTELKIKLCVQKKKNPDYKLREGITKSRKEGRSNQFGAFLVCKVAVCSWRLAAGEWSFAGDHGGRLQVLGDNRVQDTHHESDASGREEKSERSRSTPFCLLLPSIIIIIIILRTCTYLDDFA